MKHSDEQRSFFRILKDLKALDASNLQNNQMLLMSLIMTCCDLSDQVRPFPTSQNVAVSKLLRKGV